MTTERRTVYLQSALDAQTQALEQTTRMYTRMRAAGLKPAADVEAEAELIEYLRMAGVVIRDELSQERE